MQQLNTEIEKTMSSFQFFRMQVLVVATVLSVFGQNKEYENSRYNYRVAIPAGWNTSTSESGVLTALSYPQSEGGPQGLFPLDGAQVIIVPYAAVEAVVTGGTLANWAKGELHSDHTNVTTRRIRNSTAGQGGPTDVIEVKSDFTRDVQDPEPQREVSYYFMLHGAAFHMMLLYWKDNSHVTELEATSRHMLESMRRLH